MREAVIVSVARTPIGKAYRGAFNNTPAATLASYSLKEAVSKAKIDPSEIEDVVMGCAQQQGTQAQEDLSAAMRPAEHLSAIQRLHGALSRVGDQGRRDARHSQAARG